MTESTLAGQSILVTRPARLAGELADGIENLGGEAVRFPTLEIAARDPDDVGRDLDRKATPDIAVFVSRNAVEFGFRSEYLGAARIAAIGPATRAALEARGANVGIYPAQGFDSEHLLECPALQDVAGLSIRIVRGVGGRELLADTLQKRGAEVHYLSVYERKTPQYAEPAVQGLAGRLAAGTITMVMAMSVQSLTGLLEILPQECHDLLRKTLLVTPSERVIQTANELLPGISTRLSSGPLAEQMIRALTDALGDR